jgi:hypothetical protein
MGEELAKLFIYIRFLETRLQKIETYAKILENKLNEPKDQNVNIIHIEKMIVD